MKKCLLEFVATKRSPANALHAIKSYARSIRCAFSVLVDAQGVGRKCLLQASHLLEDLMLGNSLCQMLETSLVVEWLR